MMARRRTITIAMIAWLPLLVLSALEGNAWSGTALVPFLKDFEAQNRFFSVALPILILAELVVHQRMRHLIEQFVERNLISGRAVPVRGRYCIRGAPAELRIPEG